MTDLTQRRTLWTRSDGRVVIREDSPQYSSRWPLVAICVRVVQGEGTVLFLAKRFRGNSLEAAKRYARGLKLSGRRVPLR